MKPKTMILMVVAVVCGLGASYMTSRLLAERDDTPAEAPPIEKVKLLVAKKKLDMHLPMRAEPEKYFIEKEFVKDENVPKDALTKADVSKLNGKFLKREMRAGSPLVLDDFVDKFGLDVPAGMRAVGIQVNQASVAGGWASLPGSHVDLVWTSRVGGSETFSKLLLEDVIVLSADGNDTQASTGAIVASVVTVAVTADNQMKLILAMETGTIKLGVRKLGDVSTSDKDSYGVTDLKKPRDSKIADPIVADVTPPIVLPIPDKDTKPEMPEMPQQKLTKRTVTVRQGHEYQIHHYWVDEEDRIVAPPSANDNQFDPLPKKDESKRDDNKNG
ncbi:MAG TPA: Flp pilus assembly protein CpaB [Gemmataceae bacterium]|nr:Flp pilus assembly protein CpaB [Gemmataceae bacterium]